MRTHTERSELLTVREVAKEWRQHPGTIYRKIANGELHAVRLGDHTAALRIRRRELERSTRTTAVASPWWELERSLPPVRMRSATDRGSVLYGQFARSGEWAEIKSKVEGHFMECVSSRAFAVSIHENRDRIRVLYHHALDPSIGTKPLASGSLPRRASVVGRWRSASRGSPST